MLHFLGIGAQKSGTTWIWEQLKQHPQIFTPENKEVHFWDTHYNNGIGWYNSLFFIPESKYRIPFLKHPTRSVKAGEITPAYSFLPTETIQEIRQLYPNIRIFYILRNPVDRAWSAALMALRNAEMTIDEASDQWFIDHFNSKGSLMRGDYETCLNNWLMCFDKEQILVLDYKMISQDPRALLRQLCEHIDIDSSFYDDVSLSELQTKVYSGNGESLPPSLRAVLEEIYKDKITFYNGLFG